MIEAVDTRAKGLRRPRSESVDLTAFLGRLDWILLGAVAALVGYGLWAIGGITQHDIPGNSGYYVVRQGVYAAIGAVALVAVVFIDPEYYRRHKRVIYVGTLSVMLLVLMAGTVSRHSKRWLDLGFFRFQPSEFGKLLFVLFLAGFLADRARRLGDSRTVLQTIGFAAGPILLVFIQPDVGTAMVYAVALAAVLFVAGTRWTHLAVLGAGALAFILTVLWILPSAGIHVLKPYQQSRLTGFTNPSSDPQGATYNVRESINAVGAGGLSGRGPKGATQTNYHFLPEHATDFAFASLAEERGFFGASIVLLLYLLVVWRALKIVAGARDLYCAIVAGGIAFMFLFQVFVNSAMTMGIAPITGIPLPFVSVGGSSMITNFLALGLLQAIYMRRPVRRRSGR